MERIKMFRWYFLLMVIIITLAAPPVFGFGCCGVPIDSTKSSLIQDAFGYPQASDFSVNTLDGGTFNLSSQRGKPVILLFIDSSCDTCLKEARELGTVWLN